MNDLADEMDPEWTVVEPKLPPPDLALIDGTPENKAWERAAATTHDQLIHDVESCPLCRPGLERLAEAVERIRAQHDRTLGHSPTNRIGYCAEPDGISATYCETGILLAGLR